MYPRLKYIWKYMDKKDNTGLQIKETLDDARAKSELLEHGCLAMAVFYYGLHKPWNKNAAKAESVWSADQQAAFIKGVIAEHDACAKHADRRNAFWAKHAKEPIVERRLFEWECGEFERTKQLPGEAAKSARCAHACDKTAKVGAMTRAPPPQVARGRAPHRPTGGSAQAGG